MKIIFTLFQFFLIFQSAFSQSKLDTSFLAYRHGKIYNDETKQLDTFVLCGQNIIADTIGFFIMQSGCERNIGIFLGHYTYQSDTFKIKPFDFIKEPEFLYVKKIISTNPIQKIQFFTADLELLKGVDSSWVIRLFKRRKSFVVDKTGENIISLKRKQFDGMELLQMTKLFGVPIILFLDHRFDYKIVLNLPKEAVERFIVGGGSIGGIGVTKDKSFFLNKDTESFKIINTRKTQD